MQSSYVAGATSPVAKVEQPSEEVTSDRSIVSAATADPGWLDDVQLDSKGILQTMLAHACTEPRSGYTYMHICVHTDMHTQTHTNSYAYLYIHRRLQGR